MVRTKLWLFPNDSVPALPFWLSQVPSEVLDSCGSPGSWTSGGWLVSSPTASPTSPWLAWGSNNNIDHFIWNYQRKLILALFLDWMNWRELLCSCKKWFCYLIYTYLHYTIKLTCHCFHPHHLPALPKFDVNSKFLRIKRLYLHSGHCGEPVDPGFQWSPSVGWSPGHPDDRHHFHMAQQCLVCIKPLHY